MSALSFLGKLRQPRARSNALTAAAFAMVQISYGFTHMSGSDVVARHLQLYKDGKPVALRKNLADLCESCLETAKISRTSKSRFTFFMSSSDEPTHFGYAAVRGLAKLSGVFVGLPYYFLYDSKDEVDTSKIAIWIDGAIPWKSKNGEKVVDSLVMSEKAKKFVILRQIYMSDSSLPYLNALNLTACFGVHMLISRAIWRAFAKVPYRDIPIGFRTMMKTMQMAVAVTLFVIVRDIIRQAVETRCDLQTVEHGDEYYEGAIEFYSKLINRNKAFSFFLGDEGRKYYTSTGDPKPPLHHKYFKPISKTPNQSIASIQDRFGHYIAKDEPISN